jgi:hypothetical protein
MRSIFFCVLSAFVSIKAFAQIPGDTIVVSSLNYASITRDTVVNFPNLPGVTFEKIIMLYNMRCKNGLVSSGVSGQTNVGCGEWDYSCNTNIVDSTTLDSTKAKHPSHIITGFSGTTYNYTPNTTYTYHKHMLQLVNYDSIISETSATIGLGATNTNKAIATQISNGKAQYLWTAAELNAAGIVPGNITSLQLNLLNAGAEAHFLKIKIKATTKTELNNNTPDLTGFTEVYALNTIHTAGVQQYKFHTPFNWNGTDNIIIEFSFSNATNGLPNIFAADSFATTIGLVSSEDDYAFQFDGANNILMNSTNYSAITDEISLSFWAKGDATTLPSNTAILTGTNAQGARAANVHLPWSDQVVYWDCGQNGSYDRINKASVPAEYKSNWSHWIFTKNKTTGVMNIYLNGVLWHAGTGKTLPIGLTQFQLGSGYNGIQPYFGSIDDFSIWKKEITAPIAAAWYNKKIDSSHPLYSDLVAQYNLNEGTGILCLDATAAGAQATITGNNHWAIHKGEKRFKNFDETAIRPTITLMQGQYAISIDTIFALDSIQNMVQTVRSFAVDAGNNLVPVDTQQHYMAGYSYIFDATTNVVVDSVLNTITGTINITQLDYFKKAVARYQIMSFVTPYGINLDLGMAGKTWTFDVTDFAPILKGPKRMFIDAGGEFQEQMDIKFLFIVGTPPREVKSIRNIWPVESVAYTNIMNDTKFEPRQVLLDASGKAFKIKTAITGHGQEGEFIPRTHTVNVNGGAPEFSWDVWKACGSNPVYPQGGTWIYDRAGWCPGMATDIKEMDITPLITPGTTAEIDYHLTTAAGASNYWVSNQLITYGDANFTLDAAIVDIINPSNKVEYARSNPRCMQPKIVLQNTGITALTKATIEYWVNSGNKKETFEWSGNLTFLEKAEVSLPIGSIWSDLNATGNSTFCAEIKSINNATDAYTFNNKMNSVIKVTPIVPSDFYFQFRTNAAAAESAYRLKDENGNVIFSRNNMNNNTLYTDTFKLAYGCYVIDVLDTDNDGIGFWANNDGNGFARLRRTNNTTLHTFQPDFGDSISYQFTVDFVMNASAENEVILEVYPNPAHNNFTINLTAIEDYQIEVYNICGQKISLPFKQNINERIYNTQGINAGVYYIKGAGRGKVWTQKIVVQ